MMNFRSRDIAKMLEYSIGHLSNVPNLMPWDDPEQYSDIFENLLDHVDSIDVANDFAKLGGVKVMKSCLDSCHSTIRCHAANLLAELAQNNPQCQTAIKNEHLLKYLLELLDGDDDSNLRIKALYAISCYLRNNSDGREEFLQLDGFSYLLRALQSGIEKLQLKAAFLLMSMCTEDTKCRQSLYDMGFVEQLVSLIHVEPQTSHEHLLGCLLAIIQDHPESLEESRRPELRLKELLDGKISSLKGSEESTEEYNYCNDLLNICFPSEYNEER